MRFLYLLLAFTACDFNDDLTSDSDVEGETGKTAMFWAGWGEKRMFVCMCYIAVALCFLAERSSFALQAFLVRRPSSLNSRKQPHNQQSTALDEMFVD